MNVPQLFFKSVTWLGSGAVWIPAYALIFWLGDAKAKGVVTSAVVAELLGLLFVITLRNIVKKDRPKKDIKLMIEFPWDKNSFPSHHAIRMFFVTILFGTGYPNLLLPLIFFALLISYSRIYLKKHFVFDVAAGALIGMLCACAAFRVSLTS